MTNEEFSNGFDTLLSAYQHTAQFGEQSSIADVTLDEYEKSIFLTQAQDQIVKSYFERQLNSNGEGFDDSTRRQLDYSNLITTSKITNIKTSALEAFSDNGVVLDFSDSVFGVTPADENGATYKKTPLFIINERVIAEGDPFISYTPIPKESEDLTVGAVVYTQNSEGKYVQTPITSASLDDFTSGTKVGYTQVITKTPGQSYVIIPLNYKDYDRMQSRAYNEPLKRQAWRLFETDVNTLKSSVEIILRSDAKPFYQYVVRYIRRPRPIVLVDLSDTANSLTIDGVSKITQCELNPIIHNEILQLAVQLALTSKGIETRDMKAAREANKD